MMIDDDDDIFVIFYPLDFQNKINKKVKLKLLKLIPKLTYELI